MKIEYYVEFGERSYIVYNSGHQAAQFVSLTLKAGEKMSVFGLARKYQFSVVYRF